MFFSADISEDAIFCISARYIDRGICKYLPEWLYLQNSNLDMNCIHHPSEPSVTQCADCGRGLCAQCAGSASAPLCPSCSARRRRGEVVSSALYLALYAVLFSIGYRLDFMATENSPDMRMMSGYTLMAAVSGWQFINRIVGWRLTQASAVVWVIYFTVKLLVSAAVGFITAAFTVAWNIVKLIRNITK